ncbi:MAG: hypothetical protein ACTIC1_05705 [Brevibacterium sp.]|uniref:hypothetical protein n=1 Tax=Brevibacterium aurantiacum TaxID=273384 RepID=UPI003F918705
MNLDYVLENFTSGDENNTWAQEFRWIIDFDAPHTGALLADIEANGIKLPILLGDDGRVWNGHHRLLAARILGFTEVPVVHADDGYTDEEAGYPPEYREDGS